jgi:hypothetical protein
MEGGVQRGNPYWSSHGLTAAGISLWKLIVRCRRMVSKVAKGTASKSPGRHSRGHCLLPASQP